MIEATSCGGVVIFRGKVLVLIRIIRQYEGWVCQKELSRMEKTLKVLH
jgi:hypothetical protein